MSTQLKLRRGTTAQHSTFTGASGEVTVDTSKKTLVVHDGATAGGTPLAKESQLTAPNISFQQSGTGATARTVDLKLKDWVSVKDFGAVGDGTTDDTAAVQAAMNSGRSVYLPSGTYKVTSIIALPENVTVFGEGKATTILGNGENPVVTLLGTSGTHKSNLVLRDLTIKRTGGIYGTGQRQPVEFQFADNCTILNVTFDGGNSTYGGYLQGRAVTNFKVLNCLFINGISSILSSSDDTATGVWSQDCIYDNCRMIAASQGFNVIYCKNIVYSNCIASGSTSTYGCGFIVEYQCTNITYTDCISYGHVRAGFYYEPNVAYGIAAVTLNNCIAYGNGECGLYSQNSYGLTVNGGAYHSNTGTFGTGNGMGISIQAQALDVQIVGANVFSNQVAGVYIDSGNTCIISNNRFFNNNGAGIKFVNTNIVQQVIGNTFRNNLSTVTGWNEAQTGNWPDGPWKSYTPTFYKNNGSTTFTPTAMSVKFKKIGSVVHVVGSFNVNSGTLDNGTYFTLPFAAAWTGGGTGNDALSRRGSFNGDVSGNAGFIDGRYFSDRLFLAGTSSTDTFVRFHATYEI